MIEVGKFKVKENLYYYKEHEWLKVEDDVGSVGISDFAQSELGDIVYIELPRVGKRFSQFQKICEIESVKAVSDIFTPISGEILEVNSELEDSPELMNDDPYGSWIAKLKISDTSELENLMSAIEYSEFIAKG